MGLLSHIESIKSGAESAETAGLPSRQEPIQKEREPVKEYHYKPFDFHDFADEVGLRKSAVLVPFASRFFMRYSHGFDVQTIFKSVSTADFWDGTFSGIQDWQVINGIQLEPYYQLFSPQEIHDIKELYIKSFPLPSDIAARAIMFIADTDSDSTETLNTVIEELSDCISSDMLYTPYNIKLPHSKYTVYPESGVQSYSFTLFFEQAIQTVALETGTDPEAAAMLEATVFSEVYIRLCAHIGKPNACIPVSANTLELILVSQEIQDEDIVLFQCKKTLTAVLGKGAQQIRIVYNGTETAAGA